MAETFTTWSALKTQLLNDFARGAHTQKTYTCGDTTIEFRSFAEFKDMLAFVEARAAIEASGRVPRRTYAGMGSV